MEDERGRGGGLRFALFPYVERASRESPKMTFLVKQELPKPEDPRPHTSNYESRMNVTHDGSPPSIRERANW